MPFAGEVLIGLSFWETRCASHRHDLIVYRVSDGSVHRICTDDSENMTGCGAFLKNWVCDLAAPIDNMKEVMT
jgi:hypothetical protein